jgi:ubiquinone/menaquinone biosynthesis C-methylase UbiE
MSRKTLEKRNYVRDVWNDIFQKNEWGKYPSEELVRFIAKNFYSVSERSTVKLLEVGCGTGANLWFMAREGFSVYGIDISNVAIHRARHRLETEVPSWNGELRVGDMSNLPYDDNMFDGVIDHCAIYCNDFKTSQKIYRELARVAKKGGKLFSRTFATGSWGDKTGVQVAENTWITKEGPTAERGVTRFTELEEIPILVQGFKVTSIESVTRTFENRKHTFTEWIIIGEKE